MQLGACETSAVCVCVCVCVRRHHARGAKQQTGDEKKRERRLKVTWLRRLSILACKYPRSGNTSHTASYNSGDVSGEKHKDNNDRLLHMSDIRPKKKENNRPVGEFHCEGYATAGCSVWKWL